MLYGIECLRDVLHVLSRSSPFKKAFKLMGILPFPTVFSQDRAVACAPFAVSATRLFTVSDYEVII